MAEDPIREVLERNSGRPCLTCSFQAEDMIVLQMLLKLRPDTPVLFLDTGYHFRETYEYRDRMARECQLNLVNVLPVTTLEEHQITHGKLQKLECGIHAFDAGKKPA